MRLIGCRVLFVLGTACMVLGLLAGLVNREVVDSERFAAHVNSMRQDPDVARELGLEVSDRLIASAPELVALRPLVESVASSTIASPAASGVVRTAAVPLHRAITTGQSDAVILRLADIAAVAVAALKTLAPDVAARLPADMDVTLSEIGATRFDSGIVEWVHWVRLLAWLLPLLGIILLLGAILGDRDLSSRGVGRVTARTLGASSLWVAGVLVSLVLVVTVVAAVYPTDDLQGALFVASWHEVDGRLWLIAALALLVGLVLQSLGGLHTLPAEGTEWAALRALVLRRPETFTGLAARGGVLVAIGVLTVIRPLDVLAVLGAAAGLALVIFGGRDVLLGVLRWWRSSERRVTLGRVYQPAIAFGTIAVVVTTFAFLAWPRPEVSSALTGATGDPDGCNGHVELCDRPYDEVSFVATHNSMSAQDQPGWFIPEQPTGVIGQLRDGIRVFLLDSWYGQLSNRPPTVANTEATRAEALAAAEKTYGREVVDSALRVRNSFDLEPVGPVRSYLCHELCELGATEWLPLMVQVRDWMMSHPREVVTFFVQDKVSPESVEEMLRQAGLYDMLFVPTPGVPAAEQQWPTLGEMIETNHRLVWLHENVGGGTERPWVLDAASWVQETPYDFRTVEDFTCAPNRGTADAPLFLVNHWLGNFTRRIADSTAVNAETVLGPRVEQCRTERGMIPNYVGVNYYSLGDALAVVDRLNGLDGVS